MRLFEINNIIIDYNVSYNNFSCLQNNIKEEYFQINPSNVNYDLLYSRLPLYYDNIDELTDGVYVWMLLTCDEDEPRMYIAECQNINEIGTKHSNIVHRLHNYYSKSSIFMHYSGEMKKVNNEIILNFSSGSYMREIFEDNELFNLSSQSQSQIKFRNFYVKEMIKYLNILLYSHLKISFASNDVDTFITRENVPLKMEHLLLYKECDCVISKFYSVVECRQYLSNKKSWQRYECQLKLYEINKIKYDFLKPPEKPAFVFNGEEF